MAFLQRLGRFPTSFVLPAVLVLAAIVAFPTVYLLFLSVRHWVIIEPARYFDGLGNFVRVLRAPDFWDSARVTFAYIVATSLATLVLGMGLALSLNRSFFLRGVVRALIVLPLLVPPIVSGFAWKFLLNREIGVLGSYLLPAVGVRASLLADPNLALFSVVVADMWSRTSFMFLILIAALQSIPAELYEAARIDGASTYQEFRYVTLPLLVPAIVIGLIFRAIEAINTFDLIYVMTQGGPGTATMTLSIYGWKVAFTSFDGRGAAIAVMMLVATVLGTTVLVRRIRR
ncbi:MAG: sugar ABC transporter permease [Deinococcales bacterium]